MSTEPVYCRRAEFVASYREVPAPTVSISTTSALRLLFVVMVLAAEAIIPPIQTARQLHFVAGGWMETTLVQQVGGRMRYFALASVAMTIFLSWNSFVREAITSLNAPSRGLSRASWLLANLLFSLALSGWSPTLTRLTSPSNVELWFALRAVLALGAVGTGALALMPASFWWRWYACSRQAFLWGFLLGIAVHGLASSRTWRGVPPRCRLYGPLPGASDCWLKRWWFIRTR